MLPIKFATPLIVDRQPSKQLLYYLVMVHCLALLSIFLIDLLLWIKASLLFVVILSGFSQLYLNSGYSPSFLNRLIWGEHYWRLFSRKQGEYHALLGKKWCIHPFFIVLEFISDAGIRNLVFLTRDSIGQETFQLLSVRLSNNSTDIA